MERLRLVLDRKGYSTIFFLLLCFIIHGITLTHSYNIDDELVTLHHPRTSKGFAGISEILSSPYYQDSQGYSYEYRPITHISFAIEHQIFGEHPFTGHLINVLLFFTTCVVLLSLIKTFTPDRYSLFPMLAVVLFAVHPMHVEVVASIKNRDELLALLFGLLALRHAFSHMASGKLIHLGVTSCFLLLALFSKASVASFFVVIPLVHYVFGASLKRTAAMVAITIVVLIVFFALKDTTVYQPLTKLGVVLTAVLLLWIFKNPTVPALLLKNLVTFKRPSTSFVLWPAVTFKDILAPLASVALWTSYFLGFGEHWLVAAMVVTFIAPYWCGHHVIWHYVAALPIMLSASYVFNLNSILLLFFLQVTWLLSEKNDTKWKRIVILIIPVAHLLLGLYSDDTAVETILVLIPYIPILAYLFFGRMVWENVFLVLLLILGVVTMLMTKINSDIILAITYAVFGLVIISEHVLWKKKWVMPLGSILISIGCLAGPIWNVSMVALEHKSQGKRTEKIVERQRNTKKNTKDSIEDRPLTYSEYPLGSDPTQSEQLGTAAVVLGHYLKMMFIAWPQAFYYGAEEVSLTKITDSSAILSATVHSLLLIVALYLMGHHPVLSFAILSYLTSIFLFSTMVSPVAGMVADRLTYVASFGFCLSLGYIFQLLFERFNSGKRRKLVAGALALLIVCWSGMTIARNAQWKDALTLMRHDIEHVPNSAQAHNLLASHLMKNSFEPEYQQEAIAMRLEAIDHFKRSIRIYPDFFNVWYDLGRVYLIIDDPESALPCFKEAHRLDSTYYDATFNVAMIADKRGDATTAITYYEKCIRINPEMLPPYNELSYLLYRLGQYEASIAVNEKAIAYNANWPDPYKNIAQTYAAMNQPEKGQAYLQRLENMK